MLISPDRRTEPDRRAEPMLAEPLERHAPRRLDEDRRDAPRALRAVTVTAPGVEDEHLCEMAFLGLEGVSWRGPALPEGTRVVLAFTLPELAHPVESWGTIHRAYDCADREAGHHARFEGELPVATQLALARFVESRGGLDASLRS